jgi:hypothetical protein
MASSGPRLDRHRTRRELCSRRYPRSDDETNLVATIAALGLAGISTSACAQECKGPVNIPIDDPVSAQTAKCLDWSANKPRY